jgi:hypothetical protein
MAQEFDKGVASRKAEQQAQALESARQEKDAELKAEKARAAAEKHPVFLELKARAFDPRLTGALEVLWQRYAQQVPGFVFLGFVLTHKKCPFEIKYHFNPPFLGDELLKCYASIQLHYSNASWLQISIIHRAKATHATLTPSHSFQIGPTWSGENRQAGYAYEVVTDGKHSDAEVFYSLDDLLVHLQGIVARDQRPYSYDRNHDYREPDKWF